MEVAKWPADFRQHSLQKRHRTPDPIFCCEGMERHVDAA
jgi:hypothetical protein